MKYYAVTEDPNELFHYGVKGMKWGQHIFGDKPKSPGYKRALGKLRASAAKQTKVPKSVKIEQRQERKLQREQDRYAKAVQKAQRNMELVQNLSNIDSARKYERGIDKEYWSQVKAARSEDRQNRKYDRVERHMNKYVQQARQGKLKYGKLSDDQVQRVTERLAMERNARQLGSAEKTWRQQKKEAFRQGKLQGITKGTAAAMEEVARAGTIYGIQNLMNRKKRNALAKQQGKEQRLKNREQNKKSAKDIREEVKQEAYEAEVRSGKGFLVRSFGTHMSVGNAGKILQENKNAEHERQRIQNVQDRLANERDEKFGKLFLEEKGYETNDAAMRAHRKELVSNVEKANQMYGLASDQAIAARVQLNKFDKATDEQKQRLMISHEAEKKKQEEESKKAHAVDLYRKAIEIQQQNNIAMARFNAKMHAYQERLKRGQATRAPVRSDLIDLPEFDAESLSILNSMGLNPYKNNNNGGGGGGKKGG